MNSNIKIKEISKLNLAYVSCIGSQNIETAYQKLLGWATSQGLMNKNTKMVTMYHDSFKYTEASKVRISASILLYEPINTGGAIKLRSIEEGKYIIGSFEIGLDEFKKSWKELFAWMRIGGYKKAEGNPFQLHHNNFNEHPDRKAIVDFYIPVS